MRNATEHIFFRRAVLEQRTFSKFFQIHLIAVLWLILQPVIEYLVYLLRGAVFRHRIGIVYFVHQSEFHRLSGSEPMVLSVKPLRTDFFLCLFTSGGINFTKSVFKAFQHPGSLLHFARVSISTARRAVHHQTCVTAHLHWFPASCNHASHRSCHTVDINGYIRRTLPESVEDGHAGEYITAYTVDAYIYLPGCGFSLNQFAGDITTTYTVIFAYLSIKQDAGGILTGYYIKKSFHRVPFFFRQS